ncbi:Gfo/Idh/MocA family protein [Aquirufa aurantiipilula]|uniref:Gfo/Idh/MocA family oxidoreductase n=1 Tax=Aquirufa aurantiipilula TaxID=2696561 RepID=A0ABT6BJI1_9BACT|nr:Gfo/Idh/MocA family oxidoreductase [Aquirufa aurantiipilula]MDF5690375.1 Gfo/Idh/MocA family oxidoreductase [Aquirufa aurantiipilula]
MKNSRREFIVQSSLGAGAMIAAPLLAQAKPGVSFSQSNVGDTLKVALIGCGGRGTGAIIQALSTKENIQLVAMADAFKDRLDDCYKSVMNSRAKDTSAKAVPVNQKVNVSEDHKFVGFDGYKQAMALADVVILTTPPGFRPYHFEEAVRQGKQIFMEKPVATDPAGIQRVLAAAKIAKEKKLNVVVGLQRHYQNSYRDLMKRVQDGQIGDVVSASCWWNNDGVWVKPRKEGQTEMEYQMRNWYYFNWICGDHITEQHIHNIDVINWAKNGYPVRARGTGGREVRKGKDYGEIFDHHIVEFEYADGTILNSQCRHIPGTWTKVDEHLIGTKGKVLFDSAKILDLKGNVNYAFDKKTKENNPYQTEHDELWATVAAGEYKFADAENGAYSTMTSILGRMATYSGQVIEWDKAINSGINIAPSRFAWDADMPLKPDANGLYPVAVPGKTKYF